MTVWDRLAEAWGRAVGTFQRSRQSAVRGRRPAFFGSMANEGRWQGGWTWGSGNEERRHRRAIQNSWIFSAIDMIAAEAAAAEFQVVEHHGVDSKPTQIPNHPLERLLRRPNPYMGGTFLWQYSYWWLKLDGNFYWYILCDDAGQPSEIWPLPAFAVQPVAGDGERLIDHYEYQVGGRMYRIPAEYVVHIKRPNPFSLFVGLSELVAAMLPADSDLAMSKWNGAFFGKQNVMPSAIINLSSGDPNLPINPADKESLQADLEEDYSAFQRKTLVTTANSVSATLLGWNAREMDFLQGRQFGKEEIWTIYKVPAGLMDPNATEANALAARNTFRELAVWPMLCLVAEQISTELVAPFYNRKTIKAVDQLVAMLASSALGTPVLPPSQPVELEAQFEDIRPVNREMQLRERDSARGVLMIDEIRARYFEADPMPDGRGERLETEVGQTLGDFGVPDFSLSEVSIPPEAMNVALDAELRKFETKAKRALKRGESADVDFESDVIPDEILGHVRLHLQHAKTIDDIQAAFEEVAAYVPFACDHMRLVKRPFRPWGQFENRLNETIAAILAQEAQRIAQRVADDGPDALRETVLWTQHQQNLYNALLPHVEELALFGVEKVRERIGEADAVGINWNLANDRAADWARQYAGQRSRTLTETTRKQVQKQLGDWIQAGETLPDLIERIGAIVDNPVRAEMIAVTEATNTYAEANAQAWSAAGYEAAAYKPAAHVNCRCYLQPYKLDDGTKVQVWYTARDELVCRQPLTVPWKSSPAVGCHELHTTVISEGPYLGLKLSEARRLAKSSS